MIIYKFLENELRLSNKSRIILKKKSSQNNQPDQYGLTLSSIFSWFTIKNWLAKFNPIFRIKSKSRASIKNENAKSPPKVENEMKTSLSGWHTGSGDTGGDYDCMIEDQSIIKMDN